MGLWPSDSPDGVAVVGTQLAERGTRTRLIMDFSSESSDESLTGLMLLDPVSMVLGPVMRSMTGWQLDRGLRRLKALVEQEASLQ